MDGLRADYGLDAPLLGRGLFIAGAVAAMDALVAGCARRGRWPFAQAGAGALAVVATYCLGMGDLMRYASKIGKLRERERLLDLVSWSGDEMVLDAECGRGLMLVGAARRLTTGRAVGIDIWRSSDQGENRPSAAIENARLEDVDERIAIGTSDVRSLAFGESVFDVVVSHWIIHNLATRDDRVAAIGEMLRVLRPGGTLILADIQHHDDHLRIVSGRGLQDVRRIDCGWRGALVGLVSFGVFRPSAIVGRKSPAPG